MAEAGTGTVISDGNDTFSRTSIFPTGYFSGLKKIFTLAWALILVQFSQVAIHPMTLFFSGRLGKLELDSVALSLTLMNITGYSVVWGLTTACDTLFSQTFGTKNKKLIGIQLQRAFLIHGMALMVCLAFQINTEAILRLLGQDHEVARMCGKFMLVFIPGMFFMFTYMILRKYILNQGITVPILVISIFGLGVHILLQYLFLYQAQMGIEGSALGQVIGYFFLTVCTISYIVISGMYRDTWGGTLGTTELGAQSVLFSINLFIAGIPSGVGIAISITVGVALGAGLPLEAKTISRIGFTVGALMMLIPAISLVIFRTEIPALFTNDKDTAELATSLIPPAAVFIFMGGFCGIARGVMRGCGKQAVATSIIFVGLYILALPVGLPLLFLTEYHLLALWIVLACALLVDAIIYLLYINLKLDWSKLSDEARERARVKKAVQEEVESSIPDGLSEHTPLLGNNAKNEKRPIFDGGSSLMLSCEDAHTVHVLSSSLIYKRILTLCAFVSVLVIGILCRIFIVLTDDQEPSGAEDPTNITTVDPLFNKTDMISISSTSFTALRNTAFSFE